MAADTTTPVTETVNEEATTTTTSSKKEYTLDEISKHQSHDDCWLIIGNQSNGALKFFPFFENRCHFLVHSTFLVHVFIENFHHIH
jgi:hypothetical protein